MRFSFVLFVAASVLLTSSSVACAEGSTLSSVVADTQPNSISVGNAMRRDFCGRISGSRTKTMPTKRGHWLATGKSPGMVERFKLPKHGYSGKDLDDLVKKYGRMHRKECGLNNGRPFTG
ncbi:DNA polymerase bacteriophage-type [Phytophthora palmivora]|uniref:RxLR effector protein n=1 Tax=Phytophthora palmivora TaxID=4796 RepID=A0A2P4YFS1_9STRA|nr:DNA polymerase bacteriophage-type [Phytophthora palmivora]